MTTTIPQNSDLLKHLSDLIQAHRPLFKQQRVFERVKALIFGEILAMGRHTLTQVLMALGLVNEDWSSWYRLFSKARFPEAPASAMVFYECLKSIRPDQVLVLGGDGMQTPRTSRKIEGTGFLRNFRTPPFKIGIHLAQRWFHGALFLPPEQGFSRAVPLRFLPAFTPKAYRQVSEACSEWQAALVFLDWVIGCLAQWGRQQQPLLFLGDGSYDTVEFWKALPNGVNALLRSAKNRVLFELPPQGAHKNRKYGAKAPTPQAFWQAKDGWRWHQMLLRVHDRSLRYRVEGPFLRRNTPEHPLFLLIIGGESYTKHGKTKHRDPVPYLVNAVQNADGQWVLPLPVTLLLFWAWQRWELEVCHRDLKSLFGLGEKQAWQPQAACLTVPWSAWVYALLILAGYRTWGLTGAPAVPTCWWRGSQRWSFSTLLRAYRAALWGTHTFQLTWYTISDNLPEKIPSWLSWRNALYGSARL